MIIIDNLKRYFRRSLLSINADTKTAKNIKYGYLTGILYLAPGKMSGVNLCPFASPGCLAACLFESGRGKFSTVKNARIKKSILFNKDRETFFYNLIKDLQQLSRKANKMGLKPSARLNGTSDILFYKLSLTYKNKKYNNIMELFPDIEFYDYTPRPVKYWGELPENYNLTFSRKENNHAETAAAISAGVNVAIPFASDKLPKYLQVFNSNKNRGFSLIPVIDGDKHDLRLKEFDGAGVIIGLKEKKTSVKDNTGFIVSGDYTKTAAGYVSEYESNNIYIEGGGL